ncbi:hypothetical protein FQN50_007261 [Emmonsiellopsis sp. PD_5]|nr:hypothetical protein FQN50_007261 [Emmonsiellopsis sp. PD_5]
MHTNSYRQTSNWYPAQFFNAATPPPSPFAILVLNHPINENAYKILKKHASFTICADGGANRFYKLMEQWGKADVELPNAIVGDLDSITPSVKKHYEDLHVPIIHDPDQETTDFTKCLHYLRTHADEIISSSPSPSTQKGQPLDILVLGGLGGRVDQALSQIHHLCLAATPPPNHQTQTQTHTPSSPSSPLGTLYLISAENITFILRPGTNHIHTPGGSHMNLPAALRPPPFDSWSPLAQNIGIMPIAGPAVISTSGLEWDVVEWRTAFGGRMSTSNHVRAEVVSVETDVKVLFTVEMGEGGRGGGGVLSRGEVGKGGRGLL